MVEQESDKFKKWIKKSICIRSNTPIMNRDEQGSLSAFSHMDTSDLQPQPGVGGGGGIYRVTLPSEAYLRLLAPLTIFKF